LVIIVTPYLVKPVNANDIALPTDGYKAPTDAERLFMGRLHSGKSGQEDRPVPTMGDPVMIPAPSVGDGQPQQAGKPGKRKKRKSASAQDALPGFGM
jgi:pilus assembly protein CpaC